MALIEAVFKRPTSDRVLPFSVIAAEARVPADEVEHLVMKALSYVFSSLALFVNVTNDSIRENNKKIKRLKLIRGTLDQVASTASISWVQPRVLDRAGIDGLKDRLQDWCDRVAVVSDYTQSQGKELFVQ
jgi:26S proteasome regulatory subunit N9